MYKIGIALIIAFTFTGCSLDKIPTDDVRNHIEVSEFKYNTDGNDFVLKNDVEVIQEFVKITYVNDYDGTLYYDENFVLQKREGDSGDEYKNVVIKNFETYLDEYKTLEKNGFIESEIDIVDGIFGQLEKGHYRVIKEVYKKDTFSSEEEKVENTIFISTEFDIK